MVEAKAPGRPSGEPILGHQIEPVFQPRRRLHPEESPVVEVDSVQTVGRVEGRSAFSDEMLQVTDTDRSGTLQILRIPNVPGLYFVGVHFLRTRKSSLLYGVGEDAAIVASAVATQMSR